MESVDLHTHSTASDGTDTPAELVCNAKKAGLRAVALTDQDTLDGLPEAREAAKDLDIELVGGCEISTSTEMGSIHVLGLWVPEQPGALTDFLSHMLQRRQDQDNGGESPSHRVQYKS